MFKRVIISSETMMDDNSFFAKLDHILQLQLGDLKRSHSARAHFLVILGCMHAVEFLGGVRIGKLGLPRNVKSRFVEGVRLLGGTYEDFGEERMWQLRNSLTHEYGAKVRPFNRIRIGNTVAAEKDGAEKHTLDIDVMSFISALEEAANRLKAELRQDNDMMSTAKTALSRIADLEQYPV